MESSAGPAQDDDAEWRQITMDEFTNQSFLGDSESLYDVPTSLIVLLSCLYGSISVLAVVGNFLVMWVVATSRRMQSVTNCFIANLALADIVIGLFAVPFQFQAALLQRWVLPHFMCPFCPFVQALSVNVSVFTLTAIAVDRHRAIITPLSAHTSKRMAKAVIVVIWIFALSLAAPMAMSMEVVMVDAPDPASLLIYKKPFCQPSEFGANSLKIYRLVLYVFQYVIPLCVISFAYTHMAMKLWGTHAPGNAQEIRDAQHMKNKKRVIKMLVLVVALFALCWLPLQSYMLLQSFFPSINEYRYINVLFFSFDWLAMSNSCYNPFIYAIYNEKFKKEFKQRFSFGKKHNRYSNDSFENGHSYRTRTISFRSTTERGTSSNRRKSVKSLQSEPPKVNRASCYFTRDRLKYDENGRPRIHDSRSHALNVENGHRKHFSRNYQNDSNLALEDERATELYIFPHSNIVDFIETPLVDKV